MKLLTFWRKLHLKRRARDEAKKGSRRAGRRLAFSRSMRSGETVTKLTVKLEGPLDLIGNGAATRRQFKQFESIRAPLPGRPGLNVFFDLKGVTDIDACALLYLVAHVSRAQALNGVGVRGNYPDSLEVRSVLRDANFERFIGTPMRLGPSSEAGPQLQLTRGTTSKKLNPLDWMALYDFIARHGNLTTAEAGALYHALGECVENVRQHAHQKGVVGYWYAVALRPSADAPARVVVLDLGQGIARSVRRNFTDQVRRLLSEIARAVKLAELEGEDPDEIELFKRVTSDDWFCAYMATLGLRTQSGGPERGTGLSVLRETVLETRRGAMHVLSGEATVTWTYGAKPEVNRMAPIRGTSVCLEVGSPVDDQSSGGQP